MVDEAKTNIDHLRFSQVSESISLPAYEEFIKTYPGSAHDSQAMDFIAAHYFEEVKEKNTIKDLIGFIIKYPKTKSEAEAQAMIDQICQKEGIILLTGTIFQNNGAPYHGGKVIGFPLDAGKYPIAIFSFGLNGFKMQNPWTTCDSQGQFILKIPLVDKVQKDEPAGLVLGLKEPSVPKGQVMISALNYGKMSGMLGTVKKPKKGLALLQREGVQYEVPYDKAKRFIVVGKFQTELTFGKEKVTSK